MSFSANFSRSLVQSTEYLKNILQGETSIQATHSPSITTSRLLSNGSRLGTVSSKVETVEERKETRDRVDEERRHQTEVCIT